MHARRATSVRQPSGSTGSCGLLAAGGPEFRGGVGLVLLGGPDALACLRELDGNAFHVLREAVQRFAETQVLAQALIRAALAQLRDRLRNVVAFLTLLSDEL